MKTKTKLILIFLLLFLFAPQSKLFAADSWIRVKSKNFELIGNASEKNIRKVATKLEQFREVFRNVFKNINFTSPIPTTVIVFKSDQSYKPYKPLKADGKIEKWIAGFFQPGEDLNYITLSTERELDATYGTIFHEYIHFLVENNIGKSNVPPWFNEGLAEYYQTFSIAEDQKVMLGYPQKGHLELLQQNKLIPFETFFNVTQYALHQQGQDGVGLFYAQAWALMHYLIQGNGGARNPQLNTFLNLLLSGKEPKAAFNEVFQTDFKSMETELKRYVSQSSYRVTTVQFDNKLVFDSEMRTSPMSEAEAMAHLGDLLYHMNRLNEAETKLTEATAIDPSSTMALTSLGLVKMRQKDFTAARRILEKAIAADSKNYLALYNYAYVLSREGMVDSGFVSGYAPEQGDKIRMSLRRSIELNPGYAESYVLYAFVNLVQNFELDEAEKYLRKALEIAPGNSRYLIYLADLYLRKGDFSKARAIATRMAATADNVQERAYAENTIQRIDSTQRQIESFKNTGAIPRDVLIISDSMTEDQMREAREKSMLSSLNQVLRKPKPDETRRIGVVTKIDCSRKPIVFHVRFGETMQQLRTENFEGIELMSYDADAGNVEMGCGQMKQQSNAVITFLPSKNAKLLGEIVSIEFVPKNFSLQE